MRCLAPFSCFSLWLALFWPAHSQAQIETISHCPRSATNQDVLSLNASIFIRQVKADSVRTATIVSFYEPCDFALAWTSQGKLTMQAREVIAELGNAEVKGLNPADYGTPQWGARACALEIQCDDAATELARFDVDLTTAVVRFVSDLLYGRAAPTDPRTGYIVHPDTTRVSELVHSLAQAQDVHDAIQAIEPHAPGYLRAEAALDAYLILARNSADLPIDSHAKTLHEGDVSASVRVLAARLGQLGDLSQEKQIEPSSTYQEPLVTAVKHFQSRHGLRSSGVVDSRTWNALAVPIHQRITQLALTLERWRWIPHTFTEPPIVVNIPEYRVRAYDDQLRVVLSMPVIVGGAAGRKSPVLQASISEVIFHPYWNVPTKIQIHEIAPHLAHNPGFLASHDYQLVDARGSVVHLSGVSALHAVSTGLVRVRQAPGEQNALGPIKFVFPNAFDVYMHGTPEEKLFQSDRRDFSHGCIRVQDPAALAEWVLRHEKRWSADQIAAAIANPKTVSVPLSTPIPVLVVYGTGIAAEDGTVRFFDDVYGYDRALQTTLAQLSIQRQHFNTSTW